MKFQSDSPVPAAIRLPVRTRMVRALPWLVLALSLAATYSLWHDSRREARHLQQVEFDIHVKDIHALLTQRLATYEQGLRGAAGLFAASSTVSREEYRAYVAALGLKEYYPGIQGVGFSLLIPAGDKARHIATLRRQGFFDYTIRPEGERDTYTSILYIEPFADRNLRAFGYDMFSEPVRRLAMERARDTGEPAVSGKVTLVQETDRNVQAGFLMYLPVYRKDRPHTTLAERHASLLGWVYEPFRMDDLMHGIFGQHTEQVDVEIYDGDRVAPESLMHDSGRQRLLDRERVPVYESMRTVDVGGNHWTVAVYSRPAFEARLDREKPRIIAFAGIALSLAFGVLTWTLARGQAHALRLAETMNRELIKSEAGFRALFEQSPTGVVAVDPASGRIRRANPKLAEMLGYGVEELERMTVPELTCPEDIQDSLNILRRLTTETADRLHLEKRYVRRDGRPFWADVFATTVRGPSREVDYAIAAITDIDERKRAEERLRQLSTVIEQSPASVVITDLEGAILYVNPHFTELTGYAPNEVLGQNPRILQSGQTPKAIYDELWNTLVNGGVWHGELINKKKNGETYWEEAHISPVRNDAGAITHYAAIKLDITARKRMEEALRDNEQRLRRITALAPGCVYQFRLEPDGRWSFPFMSDGVAAVFGLTAEDVERSGDVLADCVLAEDMPLIQESMRRPVEYLERWRCEFRIRARDGAVKWLRGESTPRLEADGRVLWHGLITDITESQNLQERLRQSHDLLQNLSLQVPGMIYQYRLFPDGHACVPYASAAIGEIFEVTPEAVREDAAPIFAHLCPEDLPGLEASIRESAYTLRPWHYEYRVKLPRQGMRWRQGAARPQRLADGSVLWHGFITDVTEHKRGEAQEQARNRIFELLAEGGALPEILERVVDYLELANERLSGMILLTDESGRRLKTGAAPSLPMFYAEAVDGLLIGEGSGASGTAVFRDELVVIEDIQSHADWAPFREAVFRTGLKSCWSQPIHSSKGTVLGALAVYPRQPGAPGAAELDLMRRVAQLAGIAIERKHIEAELLLASSVYQASGEAIMVTDADRRIVAVNPAFTRLTGYASLEAVGRNPNLLSSGRQDQAFYQGLWRMLAAAGHWQGEIWNRRKNGEVFAAWMTIDVIPGKDGEVYRYVALLSDITEKKRSDEIIWEHANYDPLTHLPNRRLFRDRLRQEIRKTQRAELSLALLFIDLDRFKEVNDTLGHDVGDLLLVDAARRISGCVRESDTVARLGGDEFTVILPQLSGEADVGRVAQAIVRTLGEPFKLGPEVVYVSASVGITLYPADAVEIEDLLKNADQAMYVAKSLGRNGFSYFTASMQEAARERLRLINDLRAALAGGQLSVYFQPIVDLRTGGIVKAEALLRWRHPERGMVSPEQFIPLAEEVGLIHEIGDWVFRESVHWACRWHAQRRAIQVSVNKSPAQFNGGKSADWEDCLGKSGLPGEYLAVEITEGLLLGDRPEVTQELAKFHALGMRVAIDDFGTGYSSLAYLKRLDIDYLKIDRTFVRDLENDPDALALSEAIIAMAHKLGLQVIAEGVETAWQREVLAAAGCDYGQGHLFAPALPAEEFEALLGSGASRFGAGIPAKIPA